ncbi:hypothetical protein BLOT_000015 [Blomia tropicalis]|nr:hypothetical protein BLOT_000015 [Blomia tropicalis]
MKKIDWEISWKEQLVPITISILNLVLEMVSRSRGDNFQRSIPPPPPPPPPSPVIQPSLAFYANSFGE